MTVPTTGPAPVPQQCRHCTVPVDDGDTCGFCKTYVPPATCTGDVWCGCTCTNCTVTFEHCKTQPLVVDALLTEADKLLPTLLASRLASASACFPAPDGGTVYVQSSGARVSIAVTEKDPDTRQLVTREFTAELREVRP